MADVKTAPVDWGAYRLRDSFTLYELACLLHRLEPRAVFDDAHHAIRGRGGAAAEVLRRPADTAALLHLNPAAFFAPPVGDTLERLKRAVGSRPGLTVKPDTARALAAMLALPYPSELEREANPADPAPAPPAVASVTRKTKQRAAPLAAVLVEAKRKALDPTDWQSVWAALVTLAESASRPAPLRGYVEGEGVQYRNDDAEQPVAYLTREAFRRRFGRS